MSATFSIRIEANSLTVARNEYEALGAYLELMEAKYPKKGQRAPEVEQEEDAVAKEVTKAVAEKKPAAKRKPAAKKTEPAAKAEKKPEPKAEVQETEEAASEASSDYTHADIVAKAREAVKATGDRGAVDKVIKRYGHPISKITANNFEACINDLNGLIEA